MKFSLLSYFVATCIFFLCVSNANAINLADEPIKPIPLNFEQDKRKVSLGKRLFLDTRLSHDNTISCASCHDLGMAGVDRMKFSVGIDGKIGGINSPTVYNTRFNFRQFWDGRADTLEAQAAGPIHNPIEMGSNWDEVLPKLKKDKQYPTQFKDVYKDGITPNNIVDAIAHFERSLTTPNSRFDQYLRGDEKAITAEEKRGYQLFKSYGCVACHQGVNVGGNMFQKFGVARDFFDKNKKHRKEDYGRYNVTKNEFDKHVFKVPSLRLVSLTPPYFHNGSAKTLKDAVDVMFKFQLGRVGSDDEKYTIIKFLKTLAGELPTEGDNRYVSK